MSSYLSILLICSATINPSVGGIIDDILVEVITGEIDNAAKGSCATYEGWPGNKGAEWCADEGGHCTGPAKVYFGEATSWRTKFIDVGESIKCSNEAFGCDPKPIWKKRCYKIAAPTKTTYPMNKFDCAFNVLSVDHVSGTNGKYFNFDKNTVSNALGLGAFETGNYWIWSPRRGKELVRMWANANGGSSGSGHGRILIDAKAGDWIKDEKLALLTPETAYLQCVDWPSNIDTTKEGRCAKGNELYPAYHYVYNRDRGTENARCGQDANCWCCRAKIPDFC